VSQSYSVGGSSDAAACSQLRLPPFHFPNPGRGSGAEPPADGRPGVSPPENFWNSICDLVHFDAIWWQLYVGLRTRYICNFAIKIEPICQLQCSHDCTAVLPLLSNEHALKSGTFGVARLVLLGRGTTRHKSGTSREIRDGWQPYSQHCIDCLTSMCQASSSSSVAAAGHQRGGRAAVAMMATFNSPSDNCTSSSSSTHDWFSIVPALTSALDPPLAT